MKKIAMYSSGEVFEGCQTGGVKRFVELAKAFSRRQDLNLTITSQDEICKINFDGNFIKLNKKKDSLFFRIFPPETRFLFSNIKEIRFLKREKFDKIVTFDVPPAIGLVLFGFNNLILMVRKDIIGYEKTINKRWTLFLKLILLWISESLCMIRCSLIVCQCKYDKVKLKKRHLLLSKIIEKKTKILINNVNPSWIIDNKTKKVKEFSLFDKTNFRVCFIGNFDTPRKGHQLLLDAAVEVLKNENDIDFIIVGGGKSFDRYKNKYCNENIFFTGFLNNPTVVLSQCDLLVVPSYADSCPNTVMEALYANIPVIGSNAGGIPEILINEESLFELDPISLATRIRDLKCNKEKLLRLKEIQKKRCNELTFDWGNKMSYIIIN